MPVPRGLKGGLYRAGLFRPMRSAYRAIFNRSEFRSERKMRTFYSEWIAKGDIVFDVGANIGQYTEIFSSLGAHVIAIEPNPELCEGLRFLTYRGSVTVLPCAAGDTLGRAVLHIYNRDELSSLTDLWSKDAPTMARAKRIGDIEVEVTTLDSTAAEYGVPALVKIDAEGFDDAVIRGMSFKPKIVSFELNLAFPQVAERCLEAPVLSSGYEFNFVRGTQMDLACSSWLDRNSMKSSLTGLLSGDVGSGDVIARRC